MPTHAELAFVQGVGRIAFDLLDPAFHDTNHGAASGSALSADGSVPVVDARDQVFRNAHRALLDEFSNGRTTRGDDGRSCSGAPDKPEKVSPIKCHNLIRLVVTRRAVGWRSGSLARLYGQPHRGFGFIVQVLEIATPVTIHTVSHLQITHLLCQFHGANIAMTD